MPDRLFEITKAATFDAAHHLPAHPSGEPYTRLHGHSFRVEATLRGPVVAPAGWVDDLGRLERALAAVAGELDHATLNHHPGLENPTLEALCAFFAARLGQNFPSLSRILVSRPTVGESCSLVIEAPA